MGKIIAVANQKGGVGKTTTNINLSACLVELGKRVLMVDIDPQGNTTSGIGMDKSKIKKTIYDVLVNETPAHEAILETRMKGLFLIPSNIDLVGAEVELVSAVGREQLLKHALLPLTKEYDYIFIDCPPSLSLLTLNALTAADKLLVPIQCEFYALEGLSQLINTVKLVKKHLNPPLEMEGVVLTMFDPRTNLSMQVVNEVKKFFKSKVYTTLIPRNVRLGEAPSFGLPITLYDPACVGAQAYRDLANEVVTANGEV